MIKNTAKRERRLHRLKTPVRMTKKQKKHRGVTGERPVMHYKRSMNYSDANPPRKKVIKQT